MGRNRAMKKTLGGGAARTNSSSTHQTSEKTNSDTLIATPAKSSLQNRIDNMAHRVEYRRMVDFEDREAVYHLRRDAYSRHKGDSEDWGATSIDPAHEPNAVTIGLFIDKKLVGSFKVTVVTQQYPDCQSRNFFTEEVDVELAKGKMFIDPGRFVADTKATRDYPELPYLLMKVPVMACQYFDADECFSLIRKEHHTFYRRVFHANDLAGPKWYDPLEIEALLLTSNVHQVRENVFTRFPFWKASFLEMRQLFGPVENMPAIMDRRLHAA